MQICILQEAGCDSIMHAMHAIYKDQAYMIMPFELMSSYIILPSYVIYLKNSYSPIHNFSMARTMPSETSFWFI